MAKDELDLVVHLGDYIYEYEGRDDLVRKHAGPKIRTLDDYRDPPRPVPDRPAPAGRPRPLPLDRDLGRPRGREQLRRRRLREDGRRPGRLPGAAGQRLPGVLRDDAAAAPVAAARARTCSSTARSRSAAWPTFQVLDTRQYRTDQPNGDRALGAERRRPRPEEHDARGRAGRLAQGGAAATRPATWNVLAQQVMMGMVDRAAGGRAGRYSMDQWPGYAARADAARASSSPSGGCRTRSC